MQHKCVKIKHLLKAQHLLDKFLSEPFPEIPFINSIITAPLFRNAQKVTLSQADFIDKIIQYHPGCSTCECIGEERDNLLAEENSSELKPVHDGDSSVVITRSVHMGGHRIGVGFRSSRTPCIARLQIHTEV